MILPWVYDFLPTGNEGEEGVEYIHCLLGGKVHQSIVIGQSDYGVAVLFGNWAWIGMIYKPGVTAAEFGNDASNSSGSPLNHGA